MWSILLSISTLLRTALLSGMVGHIALCPRHRLRLGPFGPFAPFGHLISTFVFDNALNED